MDGVVEVDGVYFGGYVKPAKYKIARQDRRLVADQSGQRQSVVVVRGRNGGTSTFVGKSEAAGVAAVRACVDADAVIHADEATHWDVLHGKDDGKRNSHSVCYSDGSACTNQAESFFSRLRRAEVGVHRRVIPQCLRWRDGLARDNRREANGTQAAIVTRSAMVSPVSRKWAGYWQRGS